MEDLNKKAREDYYRLLEKIAAARNLSYRKGLMSTEVWLGPKQREILALNWLLDKHEFRFCFGKEFQMLESLESLVAKLKEITVYGLTIRFSEEDGVRAGITFQNENE